MAAEVPHDEVTARRQIALDHQCTVSGAVLRKTEGRRGELAEKPRRRPACPAAAQRNRSRARARRRRENAEPNVRAGFTLIPESGDATAINAATNAPTK